MKTLHDVFEGQDLDVSVETLSPEGIFQAMAEVDSNMSGISVEALEAQELASKVDDTVLSLKAVQKNTTDAIDPAALVDAVERDLVKAEGQVVVTEGGAKLIELANTEEASLEGFWDRVGVFFKDVIVSKKSAITGQAMIHNSQIVTTLHDRIAKLTKAIDSLDEDAELKEKHFTFPVSNTLGSFIDHASFTKSVREQINLIRSTNDFLYSFYKSHYVKLHKQINGLIGVMNEITQYMSDPEELGTYTVRANKIAHDVIEEYRPLFKRKLNVRSVNDTTLSVEASGSLAGTMCLIRNMTTAGFPVLSVYVAGTTQALRKNAGAHKYETATASELKELVEELLRFADLLDTIGNSRRDLNSVSDRYTNVINAIYRSYADVHNPHMRANIDVSMSTLSTVINSTAESCYTIFSSGLIAAVAGSEFALRSINRYKTK